MGRKEGRVTGVRKGIDGKGGGRCLHGNGKEGVKWEREHEEYDE